MLDRPSAAEMLMSEGSGRETDCEGREGGQPNEPAALYNYAIFLEEIRGDHDGAEGLYKRVLQVDPRDTDSLNNYGA
jgi:hypothetical protein